MGTTNYTDTFIAVAETSDATTGEVPPRSTSGPTIAELEYELLSAHPYEYTSDQLLFEVHALRAGIPAEQREQERSNFFSRSQACLRSSPLSKRYGWGTHHDAEGRVALVAVDSPEYAAFAADESLKQTRAMASSRRH